MKKKLISIVGNRPQFIKLKPLSDEILLHKKLINHKIIHTGQHYDVRMSKIFFDELNLPLPNYTLNVGGVSHVKFTSRVLSKLEVILNREKPDAIIVYGDTDTTVAASICASKMNINIFHIEAGLRSYNRSMPEEINRLLTDHLSKLHFVTSKSAKLNLLKENVNLKNIKVVGDLMNEVLIKTINSKKFKIKNNLFRNQKDYILITIHRAENTISKKNISKIFESLSLTNFKYILPCHPRTRKFISSKNIKIPKNLSLIKPLSYYDMISCINNALLVITDSGGVQKEAFFLGKPSIILRNETEWVELVQYKYSTLLKNKNLSNLIYSSLKIKIKKYNLFGSPIVSKKIVKEILNFYE